MSDPFDTPAPRAGAFEKGPERDRWGRPTVKNPVTGKVESFTRATTLARTLADEHNITEWQKRNVARGVALREDLTALAASTHPDDRDAWDEITEAALEVSGARAGSRRGTALHTMTFQVDTGVTREDELPGMFRADVRAYRAKMDAEGIEVGNLGTFREVFTVAPEVNSGGTADHVLTRPGWAKRLRVGDLKTQKDHPEKYNAMEIAIQLAVYAHGLHDHGVWLPGPDGGSWSGGMPEIDLEVATVMWLPVGQGFCELMDINIAKGWMYAKAAMRVREWRKDKSVCRPYPGRGQAGAVAAAVIETSREHAAMMEAIAPGADRLPGHGDKTDHAAGYMGPAEERAALDADGITDEARAIVAGLTSPVPEPRTMRDHPSVPAAHRTAAPVRCRNCFVVGHINCGEPVTEGARVANLLKQAAKDNAGTGRRRKVQIEAAAALAEQVVAGCTCVVNLWTGERIEKAAGCVFHGIAAEDAAPDALLSVAAVVEPEILATMTGQPVHAALAEFSQPIASPAAQAAADARAAAPKRTLQEHPFQPQERDPRYCGFMSGGGAVSGKNGSFTMSVECGYPPDTHPRAVIGAPVNVIGYGPVTETTSVPPELAGFQVVGPADVSHGHPGDEASPPVPPVPVQAGPSRQEQDEIARKLLDGLKERREAVDANYGPAGVDRAPVDPVIALRVRVKACTSAEELSALWREDPASFTPEIIELGKKTLAALAKG